MLDLLDAACILLDLLDLFLLGAPNKCKHVKNTDRVGSTCPAMCPPAGWSPPPDNARFRGKSIASETNFLGCSMSPNLLGQPLLDVAKCYILLGQDLTKV